MEIQKKNKVEVNPKDYNKDTYGEEKESFEELSINTLGFKDGKEKIKSVDEVLENKNKSEGNHKSEDNYSSEDIHKSEDNHSFEDNPKTEDYHSSEDNHKTEDSHSSEDNPKTEDNHSSEDKHESEDNHKSEEEPQIENNKKTKTKSDHENNKNFREAKIDQEEQQTSEKICRICYDDQSEEELLSPCKCSGSVGWVHNSCLQKWISISHKKECSACKYQYQYIKKYKKEFYKHLDHSYIPKLLTVLFILITTILSGLISKLLMKLLKFKSNINIGFNIKYFLFSLKYFSLIFFFSLPLLHYFKVINIREIYNNYISLYERNNTAYGQGLTDISVFIYLTIYKFIEEKINKITESEKIIANYVPNGQS